MPDQPFETLLNDGAQTASDPPPPAPPPPPSDRTQPVAQADQPPPSAKAADPRAPQADDAPHSADAGTTVKVCKPEGVVAAAFNAVSDKPATKTAGQAATADDAKPGTVNKATDSLITADATATIANQTAIPAAAVAAIAVVSPATALHSAIAVAESSQTKSGGDTTGSVKTASAPQAGSKVQQATGDTDKSAAPLVHGEAADTSHHIATAEMQPAITTGAQSAAPKIAADATQPAALSALPQNTAPTAANPAAPAPQAPQALAVPLAGVAIEIAGKALAGKNRFEIRLDPPELGRIEVRLDVDRDGNTTTRLIADRSDTLDLMRRDSAGLERALQDAGLKTADNGLQFSLRDQTMGRDPNNTPTPGAAQIVVQDDLAAAADLTPRNYRRLAGLGGGIDIRV
jgi:flagellar hook-length control protein FliK